MQGYYPTMTIYITLQYYIRGGSYMKKSLRKLFAMLLCFSLVLAFTACSKNASEGSDAATTAPTKAAPEATAVPTAVPTVAPTAVPTPVPTVAPVVEATQAPAAAAGNAGSADGAYVCYTFDNTLSDTAGAGADAVLYGSAALTTDGPDGKGAVTFDGSSGTYAELPKGLFDGMQEVTISYDVKSNSTGFFFVLGIGLDSNLYYFNRITTTDMRSAITTSTWSGEQGFDQTLGFDGTQWHNYTVVLTPTSMSLYLDGVLAQEKTDVTIKLADLGTNLITYLGKSLYDADPYFNGSIANFTVYKKALTADEVTALQ